MLYKYNVSYTLDGKPVKTTMEYNSDDVKATLTRRLKTAFPNAQSISIDPAHTVTDR
jgi:hypothetical protein